MKNLLIATFVLAISATAPAFADDMKPMNDMHKPMHGMMHKPVHGMGMHGSHCTMMKKHTMMHGHRMTKMVKVCR